jgi:hypothetical protein
VIGIIEIQSKKRLTSFDSMKKQHWQIMVDEYSFFISNEARIKPTCEKLFNLKSQNKSSKYDCCDDGVKIESL